MSDQPAAALPDGDASDFDAFYRESRDRLLAQLYAFTSDRGDAQECLAEAYMRAWQRWSQISRYDAPEAWVRTVAFRLSVNRWRKATNATKAWRRHGEASPMPAPAGVVPAAYQGVVLLLRLGPDRPGDPGNRRRQLTSAR
jgi:DNA-directed RNA polymerase specialized sigma24 family protein